MLCQELGLLGSSGLAEPTDLDSSSFRSSPAKRHSASSDVLRIVQQSQASAKSFGELAPSCDPFADEKGL